MNYNFQLINCDTDSIMFCKPDGSPFSEQEQQTLLDEINAILPPKIRMAHDGIFERVVVLKSKNYILDNGKKIKFKGSSVTDSKREPAIREMIERIGKCLLVKEFSNINKIYLEYIHETFHIQDIMRWCTKKTITKAVIEGGGQEARLNERKVWEAIQELEYQEGDKIYVYPTDEHKLKLFNKWNKDEDKQHLRKRVFDTLKIFQKVLDISGFLNYNLKKNEKELILQQTSSTYKDTNHE